MEVEEEEVEVREEVREEARVVVTAVVKVGSSTIVETGDLLLLLLVIFMLLLTTRWNGSLSSHMESSAKSVPSLIGERIADKSRAVAGVPNKLAAGREEEGATLVAVVGALVVVEDKRGDASRGGKAEGVGGGTVVAELRTGAGAGAGVTATWREEGFVVVVDKRGSEAVDDGAVEEEEEEDVVGDRPSPSSIRFNSSVTRTSLTIGMFCPKGISLAKACDCPEGVRTVSLVFGSCDDEEEGDVDGVVDGGTSLVLPFVVALFVAIVVEEVDNKSALLLAWVCSA